MNRPEVSCPRCGQKLTTDQIEQGTSCAWSYSQFSHTAPLAKRRCAPCAESTASLNTAERQTLLRSLNGWEIIDEHHLSKLYRLSDFSSALSWVNEIGDLAEREGHHPDIAFGWGKVCVDIWTHKINGLTENDFILAAKIDELEESVMRPVDLI